MTAYGTITAPLFSGNGATVSGLNATNIATGTVPSERLPLATASAAGAIKISYSGGVLTITTT